MKVNKALVGMLIVSALFAGCLSTKKIVEVKKENTETSEQVGAEKRFEELNVKADFNFATQKVVEVKLSAPELLENATFEIYDANPKNGGNIIAEGRFDSDRKYFGKLVVGIDQANLYIKSFYVGLPSVNLSIKNGKVDFDFAQEIVDADVIEETTVLSPLAYLKRTDSPSNFKTLGTWNSLGVPNYLLNPNAVLSKASLDAITATLPETKDVTKLHPAFFTGYDTDTLVTTANAITTAKAITSAAVEVTFVGEGADYKNTLAYYTYPLNNPPKTLADVTTITAIFANASFVNSGGGLVRGNRVSLGNIPVNTGIGWVLASNAWSTSTQKIKDVNNVWYSNPKFNSDKQQHSIIIAYAAENKSFIGFEDLNRGSTGYNAGSDNDFNDVIFTVNIVGNSPNTKPPTPLPPNKYYTAGTLAFEDLWPAKGDYDFNDLVVDYLYTLTADGDTTELISLDATFNVKAIGADQKNGFGFEMNIDKSKITKVTGTNSTATVKDANGLEAGQSKSVVIVFDNAVDQINGYTAGVNRFVNTVKGEPKFTSKTINVKITFAPGFKYADLKDIAPFNPFLIKNQNRAIEVHLPDYTPTNKVDANFFGYKDDNSIPASGRYYKTVKNHPWALNINGKVNSLNNPYTTSGFAYTYETADIINGYPKFKSWVESNGALDTDWQNTKVPAFIY